MPEEAKIIYTETDEGSSLGHALIAAHSPSFYQGFGAWKLETWDISLSGRIIANFPDNLTDEQKIPDYLQMCGELCPGVLSQSDQAA